MMAKQTHTTTEVLAAPGENLGEMPERDEYELERPEKVACPYCEREGRTTTA